MSSRFQLRWFWVPSVVIALGTLSIILLLWINQINKEQQRRVACSAAIMDIQLKLAVSHLWLEQYLAGDDSIDMEKVWADIDHAIALSDRLIHGGEARSVFAFHPMEEPGLRVRAKAVGFMLGQFKEIARERFEEPQNAGIGTVRDERQDAVFKEVISTASQLGMEAESDLVRNHIYTQRLFLGILAIWIVLVVVAAIGFWNRELQKKMAEEALLEARDQLERRVEERTRELMATNSHLQREVSERARVEESLRLYEEVVNNMPIGLYVFSFEDHTDQKPFRMVATNPVAAQFTGLPPENTVGKTLEERFSKSIQTEIPRIYAEVARSRQAKDLGEVHYRDEDVSDGYFSVKAFPLRKECMGIIFESITERKKTEESLRESESEYRKLSVEFHALLDAISDRLTLLSPDMRILWANKAAADAIGLDAAELKGKHCYEAWHALSSPCEYCPARRSFITGRPEDTEISNSKGEFWNVRTSPILNEEGKAINVISLGANITERVAFQAEAVRTAHLASLGELAAGVAHEVNNPINCVINYAQILANKSPRGTETNEIANGIIKEGMRIASIVRGLLSFARERKEEKAPVCVQEILKDSLALTQSQILRQGITVIIDLPADLPQIIAKPQQIQQVFLNIISNARYALNEKYPGSHEDKVIEIRGKEATVDGKPCLNITFRDHGSGIPADLVEKVMLPFFSTKPTGKGTGLGLSISHGIVKDHGGKLIIHSVKGEWTEVLVALPTKGQG